MRWLLPVALAFVPGCAGDDSSDDTASPFTVGAPTTSPSTGDASDASSGGATSTTTDGSAGTAGSDGAASTSSTSEPTTSGLDASSSGGPDCTAPTDCAECWNCAAQGPCMTAYQSCQMMTFCVPTLACLESMCIADGLSQDCANTCCMSCTDLGTCPMADAAISCIEQQCAGLCGAVTCP